MESNVKAKINTNGMLTMYVKFASKTINEKTQAIYKSFEINNATYFSIWFKDDLVKRNRELKTLQKLKSHNKPNVGQLDSKFTGYNTVPCAMSTQNQ
jgi:hypothetical protein